MILHPHIWSITKTLLNILVNDLEQHHKIEKKQDYKNY